MTTRDEAVSRIMRPEEDLVQDIADILTEAEIEYTAGETMYDSAHPRDASYEISNPHELGEKIIKHFDAPRIIADMKAEIQELRKAAQHWQDVAAHLNKQVITLSETTE